MKISIAPFPSTFLEFFINIAIYIQKQGQEVVFLNPDTYNRIILKKHGLKTLQYRRLNKYKTEEYNSESDIIKYLTTLYKIKNTNRIVKQKNQLYQNCHISLEHQSIDLMLFWNGANNVEREVCVDLNISAYFFENGYFSNTFQAQRKGVNCDAEFVKLGLREFLNFKYVMSRLEEVDYKPVEVKVSALKRFIYRSFDKEYNRIFIKAILYNYRLKKAKRRFEKNEEDRIDFKKIGKYIFFPLQVNSDTQIILNSDFNSMYDALEKTLPQLLQSGYKVILKEHPFEVEKVDYSKFVDNNNVFLVKKCNLDMLINKSEFVVNINSSVGLQAIENYKKVLVLGKSMYNNSPSVIIYKGNAGFIKEIKELCYSEEDINLYISHFKNNIFISGNWRKITPEFLQRIYQRIISN
jgi:capsular polysaccharide export protein